MKITISFVTLCLTAISVPALAQDDDEPFLLDQTVPVADADPEEAEVVAAPEPTQQELNEELLYEEFARYRRLVDEGTLDEADIAAKRVVQWAIELYGPRSAETASALNNLAIVQHRSGQFDAAIQNFSSSIEIIEAVEDRLTSSLVNPLRGLGTSQLAAGRPDRAIRTFRRAAHITQVNEGPHNIGQVEILESVAETFIRMGDIKSARKILDRIHVLNVRFYEKDPLGLIPSLLNRAEWQHRAGYYDEERASYRRAIRIVEGAGNKNDPMLIEPLRRMGESFYFVNPDVATANYGLVTTGEIYFKRAVRIAEKAEDLDYRVLVRTQLALADYFIYTESINRARKIYAEVWDFLSADEERMALRNEVFGSPSPISTKTLPTHLGDPVDGGKTSTIRTGRIVVNYNVSERGRVRDLRTEANPEEFTDLQRMVHREIRRRIFRPRAVDGELVATEGMVFEHEFTYRQSDLDAIRENNATVAAANGDKTEEQEEDGDSRE
ncbi:MAG: tetratricopeptide repeat protein [Pseudomonadota bacterium]